MVFSRIGTSLTRSRVSQVSACNFMGLCAADLDLFRLSYVDILQNIVNKASKGRRLFLPNQGNLGASNVNTLIDNIHQFDGKLQFLRGYVATVGGSRGRGSLSDINYFTPYPRISRFFSSEAPKKKSKTFRFRFFDVILQSFWWSLYLWYVFVPLLSDYENFYPKDKKEVPKQNEQKSESKGLYAYRRVNCVIKSSRMLKALKSQSRSYFQ